MKPYFETCSKVEVQIAEGKWVPGVILASYVRPGSEDGHIYSVEGKGCFLDRIPAQRIRCIPPEVQEPEPEWEKITAKYYGACRACSSPIYEGDEIYWAKGKGALHPHCYENKPEYDIGQDLEYCRNGKWRPVQIASKKYCHGRVECYTVRPIGWGSSEKTVAPKHLRIPEGKPTPELQFKVGDLVEARPNGQWYQGVVTWIQTESWPETPYRVNYTGPRPFTNNCYWFGDKDLRRRKAPKPQEKEAPEEQKSVPKLHLGPPRYSFCVLEEVARRANEDGILPLDAPIKKMEPIGPGLLEVEAVYTFQNKDTPLNECSCPREFWQEVKSPPWIAITLIPPKAWTLSDSAGCKERRYLLGWRIKTNPSPETYTMALPTLYEFLTKP